MFPSFEKRKIIRYLSLWPPFLGSGIRVKSISPDFRTIRVELRLHFWNRNYVGTQYGGSLYSMCDPFFMLILIENLGSDYIIWDKAATIRFKRPGKGTVQAQFHVEQSRIEEIREQLKISEKMETSFLAQVLDESGQIVAEVEKLLHIRRKAP